MNTFAVSSGLALGLASTLHCAGMCGAISASLVIATGDRSTARTLSTALLTHLGRITAYAVAGAAVGVIGAPAIAWLDRELAFRLAQWAGAVALMWIGLSTAGLLPPLSRLDRILMPISARISDAAHRGRGRNTGAYAAGLAWGFMPCAMVYGALFTAMLSGSAMGGAAVMTAFGVGTIPGLLAAAFGVRLLARTAKLPSARIAAGLAISLLGIITVWAPHASLVVLCKPSQESHLTRINFVR